MTKLAILQVADTGPLESLVFMLNHAGYKCLMVGRQLQAELCRTGCDTVLHIDDLVNSMGYEHPALKQFATVADMDIADLYVDVKAHRNGPLIWKRWPRLQNKTLWYRINGGQPENVKNCGDELDPPCPVITPNQWYRMWQDFEAPCVVKRRAFCFWPRFMAFPLYNAPRNPTTSPVCLIHNVEGWGYKALLPNALDLGVRVYGRGSPHGLIKHGETPQILQSAHAMVHLKSNDAPGYALFEALAAGCPIVLPRRLIWRCRMWSLFEEGFTCLCFDRETHDALSTKDVERCTSEIALALRRLADPDYNAKIGFAGRDRLQDLMWTLDRDGPAFLKWMQEMFP